MAELATRSPDARLDDTGEARAERLAARLHGPVSILGAVFVLVVIGESLAEPGTTVQRTFVVAGWVLWSLFALEFLVRLVAARSTTAFLRRNWWQVVFLIVPFLRFLALLRVSRAARAVSSAVRAGRSAGAKLSGRIGWLVGSTVVVVLGTANLLVEMGTFRSMADALHAAALATVAGEPMQIDSGLTQALDVILATYSVVVFAALAGSLGAYFLERRDEAVSRAAG